ncbi:uncharacterized protein LOC127840402 [Dreissena polymorpha]|uniref:uncharacterized protein LOC127840402 n=1 Tax=Dreissena polymorpha TaxID=45954 RepID=UPI0022652EED|nr:uncharacterized protein LOC127840402 [Dreissena polymorpha]
MAFTCAVNKCSNSAYWLNKWKAQLCENCGCLHKEQLCKCEPPFRLFPFPTKFKKPNEREKWKQLVGRRDGTKLWSPSKDSRICSKHFVEGQPTLQNPYPSLHLGYSGADKRVSRMSLFEETSLKPSRKKRRLLEEATQVSTSSDSDLFTIETPDPDVDMLPQPLRTVPWIFTLLSMIIGLLLTVNEKCQIITKLTEENENLKRENRMLKGNLSEKILQTNDDVNFYTGIKSWNIFSKFHKVISPLVNRRWNGVVSVIKNVRRFSEKTRSGPERKLSSKSEFLLMLMKLRLGTLNKDLAKRFGISEALFSRIFFAWLRASYLVLRSLVYIPEQDALIATKTQRFRVLPDLHSIIDCTELFIETPKDLFLQTQTWSDYKHHNTLKFLVACAPNSCIIYVSPVYLGRATDKAITIDCGFLDQLPVDSMEPELTREVLSILQELNENMKSQKERIEKLESTQYYDEEYSEDQFYDDDGQSFDEIDQESAQQAT